MIELRREKSRITCSPTVWTMTIELARLCGWIPLGTSRPRQCDLAADEDLKDVRHLIPWQFEYVSSDGQTVINEDARRMAEAFARAAREGEAIVAQWNTGKLQPPALLRTPSTGFRWFGTSDGKQHLRTFADFCQLGEFQIF